MRGLHGFGFKKNGMPGEKVRQAETFLGRLDVSIPQSVEDEMVFDQRIWDPVLLSQIMRTCAKSSFRDAEDISNGLLRRADPDRFSFRTLQDTVRREGRLAEREMVRMAGQELRMYGFNPETGKPLEGAVLSETLTNPQISEDDRDEMAKLMMDAIEKYNGTTDDVEEQVRWETVAEMAGNIPDNTVILCVDEVGVHQQKETRRKDASREREAENHRKKDAREGKHYEETTVVYLRTKEGSYRFAAGDVLTAVLIAFGYMLHWNLLQNRDLMIFSDGARNIKNVIDSVFSFRPYTLNLDWFHLRKHCYEVLTMALYGGASNKERNESIRYHFDKRLFVGNIEGAKRYLDEIDPSIIKNRNKIEELKRYLDNKEYGIYPYAVRKEMGIINSSNQGEKSNDLVVAQRCKHNGMSWTGSGINGMRNINLIILNDEAVWYEEHTMIFKPIPLSEKVSEQYKDVA